MTPEQWQALLDVIGSRGIDLVFAAIGGFIAAWLAFRFGIRRDRERLDAELRNEITRLRSERADSAVDVCWASVQSAWKGVSIVTAAYKQFPDLARISDEALSEFLDESRFSEEHKRQINEAQDSTKKYQDIVFWYELSEAFGGVGELHEAIMKNKVFLDSDLAQSFNDLTDELRGALISYEIWHETRDVSLMKNSREEISNAEAITSRIEEMIRSEVGKPTES